MTKWRAAWLCIRGKLDVPDLYHRVELEERRVAKLKHDLETANEVIFALQIELQRVKDGRQGIHTN